MGQSTSAFREDELDDYQELTYFTKKEIIHIYKKFKELCNPGTTDSEVKQTALPMDTILKLEELKVNPFRDRMCRVFSSDGSGSMTFEDFLDMMSVFSDNAPKSVKVEYAFRIYDFDNDDMLGDEDLREVIDRLTGGKDEDRQKLPDEDMTMLIRNICDEADLDDDSTLSFAEFEHVISKAPDFVTSFRIRL